MTAFVPSPDYHALHELLQQYDCIALAAHIRPDGDAIGSVIALAEGLRHLGKKVYCWSQDGVPESLAFLQQSHLITLPPAAVQQDVQLMLAVDTANKERLGKDVIAAVPEHAQWATLDHHISNEGYGSVNLIDAEQPAAACIVHELLKLLQVPLDNSIAEALYTGISTDTGCLRYRGTNAHTMQIMTDLVAAGVDVQSLNDKIYWQQPRRKVDLLKALLDTLEYSADGQIASWYLTLEKQQQLGLIPDDSEGMIDFIRSIEGVVCAVFLEELPQAGKIRVSLRSRDSRLNVCEIASVFGGGGHIMAAGIRMAGPLENAKQRLLAEIDKHLASL